MFDYRLQHVFSYSASLQTPEIIGALPEGIRANFYITGGVVDGPRLRGRLRPVGADWATIRSDGMCVVDVRTTIETDDGALIHLAYTGLGDLGADGHANFLRGQVPQKLRLHTTPQLRCAHPDYQWLHRVICVGIGEVDLHQCTVGYDVYALGADTAAPPNPHA